MRYAQLVVGPAGSGKSTFCSTLVKHGENTGRTINVVNLDPAAERFDYSPIVDVRELIQLDDAMDDEELRFGPNGGLVFCMEYLLDNVDWLKEALGEDDDDYILFDCPGQIELFTHMTVMKQLVELLQNWNFRVCAVYLMDSHFLVDEMKFVSGAMAALSAMVNLELPHVNVLSKIDLLDKAAKKQLYRFLEPDSNDLLAITHDEEDKMTAWHKKHYKLATAIGNLLDDYSLVKFFPLDVHDEESIVDLIMLIDSTIQYGEDLDVKTKDFEDGDGEDDDDMQG